MQKVTKRMHLLYVQDLSEMLNVSPKTIYDWVHKGLIPYCKPACKHMRDKSSLRFDVDEIREWLKAKKHKVKRRINVA